MVIRNFSFVIDPPSSDYSNNRLFDLSDAKLNRDGTLLPFHRIRAVLKDIGVELNTADLFLSGDIESESIYYFSLGSLGNLESLKKKKNVVFKSFLVMEPPVVAPELYAALPFLTSLFNEVYVHNTSGDGYSMDGVDRSKLRVFHWPQPYKGVIEKFWSNAERSEKIVVINGNHKPWNRVRELYSKRISAMIALSEFNAIDLYGRGWKRWWSRASCWLPYWLNLSKLMSIYQGECISKYEVLCKYTYCLCFENMEMKGYITEKIFDCLYSGTIPIYWGAPDVENFIPSKVYIDARKYSSWEKMWEEISNLSTQEIDGMREAGRIFLNSDSFSKYYESLERIVTDHSNSKQLT